jgi:hypothetical protein
MKDDGGPVEVGPDERARQTFEAHADDIALAAVHHLRIHYPAALKAVPKSAETSLRNSIRARIRSRFGPLLSVMADLERTWD